MLTLATARGYATRIAPGLVIGAAVWADDFDGCQIVRVQLYSHDGEEVGTCDVWIECGELYGEY